MSEQAWHFVGVGALLCLLGVSGLHPYDRTTWWLEIAPILIALPILVATYRSFPFTNLVIQSFSSTPSFLWLGVGIRTRPSPLVFCRHGFAPVPPTPSPHLPPSPTDFIPPSL